jgi:sirohydrochlorin ferrochelatase
MSPMSDARRLAPRAPLPLLMVGHGTRDPQGLEVVEALAAQVRAARPGLPVEVAYVDVARPTLAEALARRRGELVLVPLLLGAGYHVKVDIPRGLAAAPQVSARVTPALGPDPLLAEALAERLAEALAGTGGGVRPRRLVLAAAGSSDPAANADAARVARMLGARTGAEVSAAYVCCGRPTVDEAVRRLRAYGEGPVAVASYLLAPGHFARQVDRLAGATGRTVTSAPLGAHAAVARLVLRRYDEATSVPGSATRMVRRTA